MMVSSNSRQLIFILTFYLGLIEPGTGWVHNSVPQTKFLCIPCRHIEKQGLDSWRCILSY